MAMYSRAKCVKVLKDKANQVLNILSKLSIRDRNLKVKRVDDYVLIPIRDDVNHQDISKVLGNISFSICVNEFEEIIKHKSYKDLLKDKVPSQVLRLLPRSFDIVGDIAIIKLKDRAVIKYGDEIAKAIMSIAKNVRVVYAEKPGLKGEFRVKKLTHLGGERRSWTIHKEYGIKIYVDIAKAYYNPSLAEEHRRIALMTHDSEVIADLFTGVGPFPLHIASIRYSLIYAIDKNIEAIKCLLNSITMNKLKGRIVSINADANDFLNVIKDEVLDRVIMNLPHASLTFLGKVLPKLRRNGYVHLYLIASNEDDALNKVLNTYPSNHYSYTVNNVRRVIDYSPHKYIYRVDVKRI